MSDFFGKLKAGAGKVAFEADKLARVNRIQSELNQIKRQTDDVFAGLGKAVYQQMVSGENVDLESWRAKIEEQMSRVQAKESELQAANAEQYNQQAGAPVTAAQQVVPPAPTPPTVPVAPITPPPAPQESEATTKVCPSCGAEMPINSRFCTNCGAKL